MDYDYIQREFNDGVEAYWNGELPEGWDHPETRQRSPYLTGWYMASMWETQAGWLIDRDGDPMQEDY